MNRTRLQVFWIIIAAALLALAGVPARADDQAKMSAEAQAAFTNGQYADAVKLYEKIAEQYPGDPDVLYNLGTACARAGQRGLAIWRYLQALRIDPRDQDIRANLEILSPEIFQQLAITPIPPVNWLYQRFTTSEWAWAAGAAATLAMLLGAAFFFRLYRNRRLSGPLRAAVLALLLFAAVAYPFAFTHYFAEDDSWRGVVVAEKTVARAGPSANQTETDSLPVGTVLRILESTPTGWLKFSYAGGRMGFVEQDRVRNL